MNQLTEKEIEDIARLCADLYHNFNVPDLYHQLKATIIEEGFLKKDEK